MGKNFPRPTGELQGDDKAMPDRGTSTGFNGDSYESDTSSEATNRIAGIKSATKSDSADCCPGCQPGNGGC